MDDVRGKSLKAFLRVKEKEYLSQVLASSDGDKQKAADVYAGMNPLTAEDIAETIVWVASRPPHVNIDEILIKPTDQVEMGKVFRRAGR